MGRTKTLPAPGAEVRQLDFAFASCQKWDDGFFPSYRHMAAEDLDFVVHLGDYVYEYEIGADGGLRSTPVPAAAQPAPQTLEQWRARYALYKSDPDCRRRTPGSRLSSPGTTMRSAMTTPEDGKGKPRPLPPCGPRHTWRTTSTSPCGHGRCPRARTCSFTGGCGTAVWRSWTSWMGGSTVTPRPAAGAKRRHAKRPTTPPSACSARSRSSGSTPACVTRTCGGTSSGTTLWRPDSPVVATEFVGTSISTNGDVPVYGPYYEPMIGFNPHIKFFDGDRRGYVRCRVTPERWRTELRMATGVGSRTAGQYTHGVFEVADGTPGAVRVS